MTDLPVPAAARLRRPAWRDSRLLVGLVLVLSSVALGGVILAHADDRVPVYAAARSLVPGQPLAQDDLVRVDVQLGTAGDAYLAVGGGLAPDRFVLRDVRPGELVPVAAVGGREQVEVQPLTLTVDTGSAAALRVGSRVDVYVNPVDPTAPAAGKAFTGPELALRGVSVASIPKASNGLGGGAGGGQPVQVMAPTARIREIIGKVDVGARVTLVPVAGSALKGEQ